MRSGWVRAVQIVLGLVVIAFAVRRLTSDWSALGERSLELTFRPLPVLAALGVTWAMYALLVQAWRIVLGGWGQRLDGWTAARIWTVSSLGKYIPGKVWAIAGMAVMSQRAGVAAWAATGSAVILQALALGTGALVVGMTGVTVLESRYPWFEPALGIVVAASAAGIALLLWPPFVRRLLRLVRIEPTQSATPSAGAILFGVFANLVAWGGYGLSLWLLAAGILPESRLELPVAIGSFTASYVAGLMILVAPGGLGVRESVIVLMLEGPLGPGAALALAAASRVMLTITEFGAAAPFVLVPGERSRVLN